jgi:hypothetical protein
MKGLLAILAGLGRNKLFARVTFHDDTLRANQGDRTPGFSFWRALVS